MGERMKCITWWTSSSTPSDEIQRTKMILANVEEAEENLEHKIICSTRGSQEGRGNIKSQDAVNWEWVLL